MTTSKYKILIVDDEPLNVELLSVYLGDDYDIVTSYNGKDALEKVKDECPDLMLLDVMMPEMDGYDVCRVIRNEFNMDFMPIIMVTALTDKADHQRGIEAGADDFLKKPVGKFELEKKIDSLLRIKQHHDNLLTEKNKAYYYLDYVGILVAVLDLDFKVTTINKKGSDFLGYTPDKIVGKEWIEEFIPRDYVSEIRSHYDGIVSGDVKPYEYSEFPVIISTGEERLFRWYDSPLKDDFGNNVGVLISGEDITEIREAEKQLKEYADQLERSNDLKDLFTDVMRHDLLNPAGLIKSFVDLLIEIETDDRKKDLLNNVNEATEKLVSMIEDAAQLAKLESVDDISFVKVNLNSMIEDVVSEFTHSAREKSININLKMDEDCYAVANPMIERVFVNLLSNSIKYSPDGSTITINVMDIEDKWRISFTDQGDGIPNESKASVFERFKRLHKENIRGTGIGLAIVKRIMDLHMEVIDVDDNPEGQGSVFWMTLKKHL
ncbi:hybrid sensor histidine kinase/response regulator [Methanolobus bombayensis]|uniref:hybrid sensor histidine kinase/response regulator n=1 Tax=Methanolobus bombayensis TaxID=38023 RepID=UPI001AE655D7|nr:response regulator [Methanolobus bombayensis]MBP1909999.1 PAS domain S-box-containing protein [Methanolobus bombayensis]